MDIETRLTNVENLLNSICKVINLNKFYSDSENNGTKQIAFKNTSQINDDSNGIFEISEIIGDNTNAIFELADLLSQMLDNK